MNAVHVGRENDKDAGMAFAPTLRSPLLLVLVLLVSGCAHVPPYERGILAHPSMSTSDPTTRSAEEHVRAVQEGAIGGGFSAGGGCGCN
jgi:hypothetical protein